jgi:methyl-accepting chemotaxis protein
LLGVSLVKPSSSIERRMLSYFGLIAAASMLITGEFVYAVHKAAPPVEALLTSGPDSSVTAVDAAVKALHALQDKAILMGIVQAVVTLIVLVMFMKRISGPLQQMIGIARVINSGDLSRTIPVREPDEIGLLGDTINGLSSNIQELVAYGLLTEERLRQLAASMDRDLAAKCLPTDRVAEMEEVLGNFHSLLDGIRLYPPPATTKGERKA